MLQQVAVSRSMIHDTAAQLGEVAPAPEAIALQYVPGSAFVFGAERKNTSGKTSPRKRRTRQ